MQETPFKIFVVEDDEWYNRLLVQTLSLNPDYEIVSFINARDCLDNLYKQPDVVTLDYRLPDMEGLEVLKKIKAENEDIQVILISEQDDIDIVVDLLKYGAYDYIVKSDKIRDRLLNTVNKIRKGTQLQREINSLRSEVKKKYSFEKTIVGTSRPIKNIFGLLEKTTRTNITVMLTGETGTGKELVAKAIHYNSPRASKPFVTINMAAIPRDLAESELFGHEKGAFTGAYYRRIGKFEEASGGTLFFDEIAEMESSLQAKLLRVLQEKEVTRIGSNKVIPVNCRIIVASNKDLQEMVLKGEFRQDVYYRLMGLSIHLPPLRDRGNDIIILAKYFMNEFCSENRIPVRTLTSDAADKLMSYSFPGNIRELKSVVELAITLSDDEEIRDEHILLKNQKLLLDNLDSEITLREYNIRVVKSYLEKYNSNIKLVAEKLDIGVATIYRMLKEDD